MDTWSHIKVVIISLCTTFLPMQPAISAPENLCQVPDPRDEEGMNFWVECLWLEFSDHILLLQENDEGLEGLDKHRLRDIVEDRVFQMSQSESFQVILRSPEIHLRLLNKENLRRVAELIEAIKLYNNNNYCRLEYCRPLDVSNTLLECSNILYTKPYRSVFSNENHPHERFMAFSDISLSPYEITSLKKCQDINENVKLSRIRNKPAKRKAPEMEKPTRPYKRARIDDIKE